MVPKVGLEPTRRLWQRFLRPLRLPIPPFRHINGSIFYLPTADHLLAVVSYISYSLNLQSTIKQVGSHPLIERPVRCSLPLVDLRLVYMVPAPRPVAVNALSGAQRVFIPYLSFGLLETENHLVLVTGLEPARRVALVPKTSVSTIPPHQHIKASWLSLP